MASIAQEESRSISQNVTWGKRVSFQKGKVSFAYDSFLGYKKENDKLVIDEDEAVIVKMIYRMFLTEGKSISGIATQLTSLHIKTPTGKSSKWTKNTVQSILTNEKYKGDALLQKKFTDNHLNHTLIKNTGQVPQYYVENNHPAIIDRDMWEHVQIELERRLAMGQQYSSSDVFASKLICEDCGGFYGKKKWHSNSKYSRFVHQCNRKFDKGKETCRTPAITEDKIKEKFVIAYNQVMREKQRIIEDVNEIIKLLSDTSKLDAKVIELQNKMEVIGGLVDKMIKENTRTAQDQVEFNRRYEELTNQYVADKNALDNTLEKRAFKQAQQIKMKSYLEEIKKADNYLPEWSNDIWMLMVEKSIVNRDKTITFKFTSGTEVTM